MRNRHFNSQKWKNTWFLQIIQTNANKGDSKGVVEGANISKISKITKNVFKHPQTIIESPRNHFRVTGNRRSPSRFKAYFRHIFSDFDLSPGNGPLWGGKGALRLRNGHGPPQKSLKIDFWGLCIRNKRNINFFGFLIYNFFFLPLEVGSWVLFWKPKTLIWRDTAVSKR